MGKADYYADGQYNFTCDLCGRKAKSSTAMKTWDNHYVCRHHKEVRNPQDFVKGVKDDQTVPFSRSQPPEIFIPSTEIFIPSTGISVILDTNGDYLSDTSNDPILDIGWP